MQWEWQGGMDENKREWFDSYWTILDNNPGNINDSRNSREQKVIHNHADICIKYLGWKGVFVKKGLKTEFVKNKRGNKEWSVYIQPPRYLILTFLIPKILKLYNHE